MFAVIFLSVYFVGGISRDMSPSKKKLPTHQKDGNIGNCQIEQEKVGRCPHTFCPEGFGYLLNQSKILIVIN